MQTPLKTQPLAIQLFDLVLVQLSNWRWSWRSFVLTGMVAPLASTVALGMFARDSGAEALGYVLTGNVVLALMFGTLDKVAGNFAFMRGRGMLDYFATLPIHGYNLILATVCAFFLLSLPTVGVTLAFGAWFLGLPVSLNPLLLLVLPLAATSLSGVGALIGVSVRLPEEAGSLSLLVTLVMMGLGPVVVPPERLPSWLLTVGWFSPATYAASALRQALLGPVTARLGLDLLVLAALTVFVLYLVGRRMDWRRRRM